MQSRIKEQSVPLDDKIRNITLIWHEKIGQGAFGEVYRCENKDTGDVMAVKKVDIIFQHERLKKEIMALNTEIAILRKIKHTHIVKHYGMLHDNNSVSLLVEYLKGDAMSHLIKRKGALREKDVSKYFQQILEGLAYLHENKIVHRDLKCDNILLDEGSNCKLADFGTSKFTQNVRSLSGCDTFCGTINWTSPEFMQSGIYGTKLDIWSFPCPVLEMLTANAPFSEMKPYAVMAQIVDKDFVPSFPQDTSDH